MATKKPFKTNHIEEFDLDIYLTKIWIAIGADKAVLDDLYEDEITFDDIANKALTVMTVRTKPDRRRGILLYFKDSTAMTLATICHECLHGAADIAHAVGFRLDVENQEPFAYLLDYIVRCCEQFVEVKFRYPKVVNHKLDY